MIRQVIEKIMAEYPSAVRELQQKLMKELKPLEGILRQVSEQRHEENEMGKTYG